MQENHELYFMNDSVGDTGLTPVLPVLAVRCGVTVDRFGCRVPLLKSCALQSPDCPVKVVDLQNCGAGVASVKALGLALRVGSWLCVLRLLVLYPIV